MKLVVVSHKACWSSPEPDGPYLTDGGFPMQIRAISELFDETRVVVPCEPVAERNGLSPLVGKNLYVSPLSVPRGSDLRRKIHMPFWLIRNGPRIWREIRDADAVHAPIPGDVGTIGMLVALCLRKPLFVRHCGNWFVRRTAAESFWKWAMERFAGGRNVMLATGGSDDEPSSKNANIKWIFSTSLTRGEIERAVPRTISGDGRLNLIIACRQERGKGTDIVLEALVRLQRRFPGARLDVVGDGSFLGELQSRAKALRIEEKVTFHGKVQPKRVLELLRDAHVFCYPTESEGFPKVVLEALASGLPVITTRVSVLPKLINESCGVLIDQPTASHLAAAVETVGSDPRRYRRMSENAIAVARSYSLESWRDSIGNILRRSWEVPALSSGTERSKSI